MVVGHFGVGYKAVQDLSIGVSVGLQLRPLKFKCSLLQKRPWICKIRGWWEGVKGFRCVCGGGVEIPSPHLKEHTALEVPLSRFQGSPGHSVSSPGPACGSQRVQPLAVIRSSPGSRARDAARRAGGAFGGRGRLKVLLAHLAQLGALAFLPPRFCSHSCVHSARDPPSDP